MSFLNCRTCLKVLNAEVSSVDVDIIKPISEIEKLHAKNAKFVGLLTFI